MSTGDKRALVMLIQDGGGIRVVDSQGRERQAVSPEQLWSFAHEAISADGAPAITSAPGDVAGERTRKSEFEGAVGVLGGRLREVVEEEYGAEVVRAGLTVATVGFTRASTLLRNVSTPRKRGWRGRKS